jgi:hypothetical protein
MSEAPRARDMYKAIVVAGIRSKFGIFALVLMLAAAIASFATHHFWRGVFILAIIVLTFARVPAAIAVMIATGGGRGGAGRQ